MSDSRKNIQHYKIFDYWKDKAITNNGDIVDVNDEKYFSSSIEVVYDWGEPECFACRKLVAPVLDDKDYEQWLEDEEGLKKIWNHRETRRNLERAHIIPHSLGGNENPDNMFLLCKECHEESPDTNNPKNFFRYIYMKRKSPNKAYKRYMMFMQDCINRNLDFTTCDVNKMFDNTSFHGSKMSDYTWSMGLADTCKPLTNDERGKIISNIQKDSLDKMKNNFEYQI